MALVKYNNNSISDVTELAGVPAGAMTLIKTLTASSSATVDFVDGSGGVVLDSTYPIYLFKYINLHPATDNVRLGINMTTDGTNFNVTKTTSFFNSASKKGIYLFICSSKEAINSLRMAILNPISTFLIQKVVITLPLLLQMQAGLKSSLVIFSVSIVICPCRNSAA